MPICYGTNAAGSCSADCGAVQVILTYCSAQECEYFQQIPLLQRPIALLFTILWESALQMNALEYFLAS
jgi:hypothetical protein